MKFLYLTRCIPRGVFSVTFHHRASESSDILDPSPGFFLLLKICVIPGSQTYLGKPLAWVSCSHSRNDTGNYYLGGGTVSPNPVGFFAVSLSRKSFFPVPMVRYLKIFGHMCYLGQLDPASRLSRGYYRVTRFVTCGQTLPQLFRKCILKIFPLQLIIISTISFLEVHVLSFSNLPFFPAVVFFFRKLTFYLGLLTGAETCWV